MPVLLSTPILDPAGWPVKSIGQQVRDDGPVTHIAKQGTPTMGGIAMVGAVLAGYVIGHFGTTVRFSATGWLLMITVFSFGASSAPSTTGSSIRADRRELGA